MKDLKKSYSRLYLLCSICIISAAAFFLIHEIKTHPTWLGEAGVVALFSERDNEIATARKKFDFARALSRVEFDGCELISVDYGTSTCSSIETGGFSHCLDLVTLRSRSEPECLIYGVEHIKTPDVVRAIYLDPRSLADLEERKNLIQLIGRSELNAVVIDIKPESGWIPFSADREFNAKYADQISNEISDMLFVIETLHDRNIYIIGRISLLRDDWFAARYPEQLLKRANKKDAWKNFDGTVWLDPGSPNVLNYNAQLAVDAINLGFDEVNFDYVRFPGNISETRTYAPFSTDLSLVGKARAIQQLVIQLTDKVRDNLDGVVLSATTFGGISAATVSTQSVGQTFGTFLTHFDYVTPIFYPSYFPYGFIGIDADPDEQPFSVISELLDRSTQFIEQLNETIEERNEILADRSGSRLLSIRFNEIEEALIQQTGTNDVTQVVSFDTVRPWLQDFICFECTTPHDYGVREVRAEKNAVYNAGYDSWMLWNPAAQYTTKAID